MSANTWTGLCFQLKNMACESLLNSWPNFSAYGCGLEPMA